MIVEREVGLHPITKQKLIERHSDRKVMIHKVGTDENYIIAVDVENAPWTYEETDIPNEEDDNDDM